MEEISPDLHEERVKQMASRPDLLRPEVRDFAATQDKCRVKRGAEHVCDKIQHSIDLACADCLVREARDEAERQRKAAAAQWRV